MSTVQSVEYLWWTVHSCEQLSGLVCRIPHWTVASHEQYSESSNMQSSTQSKHSFTVTLWSFGATMTSFDNNNNNDDRISIVLYSHNFRGAESFLMPLMTYRRYNSRSGSNLSHTHDKVQSIIHWVTAAYHCCCRNITHKLRHWEKVTSHNDFLLDVYYSQLAKVTVQVTTHCSQCSRKLLDTRETVVQQRHGYSTRHIDIEHWTVTEHNNYSIHHIDIEHSLTTTTSWLQHTSHWHWTLNSH